MNFKFLDVNKFATEYCDVTTMQLAEIYNVNASTISKWARKLDLPRKVNKWRDFKNQKLSMIQSQIVLGSLLGDGCLEKIYKAGRESRFFEDHCVAQKDWLYWKKLILNNWHPSFYYIEGARKLYAMKTIAHPEFTNLEKVWYKRNKQGKYILRKGKRIKIVPLSLKLTPLMLAVWYFDDGYNGRNYCQLSTLSFTTKEIKCLIEKIKALGINNCKMSRQGNGHVIMIGAKSYFEFIDIIKNAIPDVPGCVCYKINEFT